ncbi:MAG: hypothetical protein AB1631_02610 [Acidobacteriota bacterium]
MIKYLLWAIVHFGAWSLILLTAIGVGHLFLRRLEFDSFVERMVFTLAVGLGMCSLPIFALGLAGLLYWQAIFALTLASAIAVAAWLLRSGKLPALPSLKNHHTLRGAVILLLAITGIVYWGLALLMTQYPPLQWDSTAFHLVLCREYLNTHQISPVTGIHFPLLPSLNHMLFVWGMALKDDIVAQMIEHTFLMLTATGLYAWCRREGKPLMGIAAAAFWLGSPLVLLLGASAYIDIGLACFVFLGVYAMRLFWEPGQNRLWLLAMALLAMAAGVKLAGLFFLLGGAVLGLWAVIRMHRIRWSEVARGWALAAFVTLPWYIYIAYHTGNPMWPAFAQYSSSAWGSPEVASTINSWLSRAGQPRTLRNFLTASFDWIAHPETFQSESNRPFFPLVAIWPVAWIASIWNRSVRWWAIWAFAFTVFWSRQPQLVRYWLPVFPLAILALYESLGLIIDRVLKPDVMKTFVWFALTVTALGWGGRSMVGDLRIKRVPSVTAQEREAFISLFADGAAMKYVNERADENERVCVIRASYLNYYFKPKPLDLFGTLHAHRLPRFEWPEDEQFIKWLKSEGVNWIFVNHTNAPDYLNIPKRDIALEPIWPDYPLVYADSTSWVFRRKPVAPDR